MAKATIPEFGAFRSIIWPIHREECKRLIPTLLMLFLICFNYSALRTMKDSLVVTTAGAEIIPFIKVWAIFPMAIMLTFIFAKLSNRYRQELVFYIMVTGFLIFFIIFGFVLFPLRETLHYHSCISTLQHILPEGFNGFISMCRYWIFTAFYVMSELWGSCIMSVLCWGFINQITKLAEAKRFYCVLSIGSNFAAITAGYCAALIFKDGSFNANLPLGKDGWEQSVMILVLLLSFTSVMTMVVFRWINQNVLVGEEYLEQQRVNELKPKESLSLKESLRCVASSNYLLCIAVIVVSYNLVINLVEVIWKDQLNEFCITPSYYSFYVNNLLMLQGIISTILALTMSYLINNFGWTKTALITPVVILISCIGFFGVLFYQDTLMGLQMFSYLGTSPIAIGVFFGAMQNALSKASKYSVFDVTKEMAFIPLSYEGKIKGKAAIDGIGSRFGKSGGSLIHQSLLLIFVTVQSSAPIVAAILFVVIIFWIFAVRFLGRQLNQQKMEEVLSPA